MNVKGGGGFYVWAWANDKTAPARNVKATVSFPNDDPTTGNANAISGTPLLDSSGNPLPHPSQAPLGYTLFSFRFDNAPASGSGIPLKVVYFYSDSSQASDEITRVYFNSIV
jgi:hypothetical protein